MKQGPWMRWGIWGAGCALALVLAAGCSRVAPEQRLREQFGTMRQALEERRPADFMDGVAADFGGNGGLDRAALQQMMRAQMLANARIGLTVGPVEVEISGDRATAKFSVVTTGGSGRFLPDSAQAWDVTSGWREEDGQWLLYYAEWTPR